MLCLISTHPGIYEFLLQFCLISIHPMVQEFFYDWISNHLKMWSKCFSENITNFLSVIFFVLWAWD